MESVTRNPARPDEIVGRYRATSRAEPGEAIDGARAAQRAWRAVPSVERGAVLDRFVAALVTCIAGRRQAVWD